jgi:pyruvate formate lyase activating enzyme
VHINCTGVSNKPILENIKYIDRLGIPIEIRYPYIPSMNDSEAEKIAEFVKELKSVKTIRILPYHNYAESKYDSLEMKYPAFDILPPSKDEILSVSQRVQKICLKTVVPY